MFINFQILFKWWKIDNDVDPKMTHRFRLLSCTDHKNLITRKEIDDYWRISERLGLNARGRSTVIRYMDISISWETFSNLGNFSDIRSTDYKKSKSVSPFRNINLKNQIIKFHNNSAAVQFPPSLIDLH